MAATEVGREFGVFLRFDQTAQGHIAFQTIYEALIGLNLRWKVGGVVHKILCDGIDLNAKRRQLDANGLHYPAIF